jgi:hypothetical protein
MNARVAGAVAAVAAVLLPAGGATAAPDPRINLAHRVRAIPLDAGYLVEVVCTAQARPASTTQVPLVTAITCSIDDFAQTQALPGAASAVTVTSAVTGPFVLCVFGEAAFLDPAGGTNPTATRGPDCRTVHP